MALISNRTPAVYVHYNSSTGYKAKHFTDAYKARSFYVRQDKLGNNPKVSRSDTMTTESTTPAATTAKAAKAAKRVPKKKTTTKRVPKKPTKAAKPKAAKRVPKKPKKAAKVVKTVVKKTGGRVTTKQVDELGRPLGLRKPQLTLLNYLEKAGDPVPRATIAKDCGINLAEHLHSTKDKSNKFTKTLVERALVKVEREDRDGKDVLVYSVTKTGLQELEKQSD